MCEVCLRYRGKMAELMELQETASALQELGETSRIFVQHRERAIQARRLYRAECKHARDSAKGIWQAEQQGVAPPRLSRLLEAYEAHYSFDYAQNLWLPQLADTPGPFYFQTNWFKTFAFRRIAGLTNSISKDALAVS
jgi:hypothetical protein